MSNSVDIAVGKRIVQICWSQSTKAKSSYFQRIFAYTTEEDNQNCLYFRSYYFNPQTQQDVISDELSSISIDEILNIGLNTSRGYIYNHFDSSVISAAQQDNSLSSLNKFSINNHNIFILRIESIFQNIFMVTLNTGHIAIIPVAFYPIPSNKDIKDTLLSEELFLSSDCALVFNIEQLTTSQPQQQQQQQQNTPQIQQNISVTSSTSTVILSSLQLVNEVPFPLSGPFSLASLSLSSISSTSTQSISSQQSSTISSTSTTTNTTSSHTTTTTTSPPLQLIIMLGTSSGIVYTCSIVLTHLFALCEELLSPFSTYNCETNLTNDLLERELLLPFLSPQQHISISSFSPNKFYSFLSSSTIISQSDNYLKHLIYKQLVPLNDKGDDDNTGIGKRFNNNNYHHNYVNGDDSDYDYGSDIDDELNDDELNSNSFNDNFTCNEIDVYSIDSIYISSHLDIFIALRPKNNTAGNSNIIHSEDSYSDFDPFVLKFNGRFFFQIWDLIRQFYVEIECMAEDDDEDDEDIEGIHNNSKQTNNIVDNTYNTNMNNSLLDDECEQEAQSIVNTIDTIQISPEIVSILSALLPAPLIPSTKTTSLTEQEWPKLSLEDIFYESAEFLTTFKSFPTVSTKKTLSSIVNQIHEYLLNNNDTQIGSKSIQFSTLFIHLIFSFLSTPHVSKYVLQYMVSTVLVLPNTSESLSLQSSSSQQSQRSLVENKMLSPYQPIISIIPPPSTRSLFSPFREPIAPYTTRLHAKDECLYAEDLIYITNTTTQTLSIYLISPQLFMPSKSAKVSLSALEGCEFSDDSEDSEDDDFLNYIDDEDDDEEDNQDNKYNEKEKKYNQSKNNKDSNDNHKTNYYDNHEDEDYEIEMSKLQLFSQLLTVQHPIVSIPLLFSPFSEDNDDIDITNSENQSIQQIKKKDICTALSPCNGTTIPTALLVQHKVVDFNVKSLKKHKKNGSNFLTTPLISKEQTDGDNDDNNTNNNMDLLDNDTSSQKLNSNFNLYIFFSANIDHLIISPQSLSTSLLLQSDKSILKNTLQNYSSHPYFFTLCCDTKLLYQYALAQIKDDNDKLHNELLSNTSSIFQLRLSSVRNNNHFGNEVLSIINTNSPQQKKSFFRSHLLKRSSHNLSFYHCPAFDASSGIILVPASDNAITVSEISDIIE